MKIHIFWRSFFATMSMLCFITMLGIIGGIENGAIGLLHILWCIPLVAGSVSFGFIASV